MHNPNATFTKAKGKRLFAYQDRIEHEISVLREKILERCDANGHVLYVTYTRKGQTIVCRRCKKQWAKTLDGRWMNVEISPVCFYLDEYIRTGILDEESVYLSPELVLVEPR